MAEFTVQETEGVRNIKLDIRDETVRAARGALSHMHGAIQFTPRLPNAADLLRTVMTEEVCIRPFFTGTGTIYLQSSLKGYHVLDVAQGDLWVLEPGVYWASEGSVDLGIYREPFWDALWAGDGFFAWKTTLEGHGRVAINTPGPVELLTLDGGELSVQGRLVLGRTAGVRFRSRRVAPFPRNLISGQQRMRVFEGTGKILVCWTPYWNEHLITTLGGEPYRESLLE